MSRVLVVDDDRATRDLLGCILTRAGHSVVEAEDAASALAVIRRRPPSLIVTDLVMPLMGGGDLLAAMERDRRSRRIPVVVVTGHEDGAMAEALVASGLPVLRKPVSVESLLAVVAALLG